MAEPIAVTDETFEAEVLRATEPVLVDFWAAWCGPCRMVTPVVEEIAKEHNGRLKVVKVDVDGNLQTANRFRIMSIPTLILFKGGEPVQQLVGYMPKAKLMEQIAPHL